MRTITLPPDLEDRLAEEAHRRGTTPELLAVDTLRRALTSVEDDLPAAALINEVMAEDDANDPFLASYQTYARRTT
jgi:hypothetical protein